MIYRIEIPNWHPATVNKLLQGRFQAARLKRIDRQMIMAYSRGIPKATCKRRVEFIIYAKGGRSCDPDAYFKSGLDALVQNGLLTEDDKHGVVLMPVQYEVGPKATTIVLYE